MNTKELADELIESLRKKLPAILAPDGKGVKSVCVAGSYARGDFIPANSDIDFYIVYQPETVIDKIPDYSLLKHGPAYDLIHGKVSDILGTRFFSSHCPDSFDWVPVPWEWLPKTRDDICLPEGVVNVRLLNIFLFDFIENLLVLWGDDPRQVLPQPLPIHQLAEKWFQRAVSINQSRLDQGNTAFIPCSVFNSLHVAQIVFGEQTLNKLFLADQFKKYVPDFPLKKFGLKMIQDKLNQRYPDKPFVSRPIEQYLQFEKQLAELVIKHVNNTFKS